MKKVKEYLQKIAVAKVVIKNNYKNANDPKLFAVHYLMKISKEKDAEVMAGTISNKEGGKIMEALLDFSEWIYNNKFAA